MLKKPFLKMLTIFAGPCPPRAFNLKTKQILQFLLWLNQKTKNNFAASWGLLILQAIMASLLSHH
jgi:hypothetical protein